MSVPENWELFCPIIPPLPIIPEPLFDPDEPRFTVQPASAIDESSSVPPIAIERIVNVFNFVPNVNLSF